jgi:hypothetical protein
MKNTQTVTILNEDELFNKYKGNFKVIRALADLYVIRHLDPNAKIIGKIDDKGHLSTHISYSCGFSNNNEGTK